MTHAFYLKNHTAPGLTEVEFPDLIALPPRPTNTFLTKKDFLDWSHNGDTEHAYFNLWEPVDSASRLTKDNPARFMHGLVADYDVMKLEESAVARAIADCPPEFPVSYVSRTYSGGIRMVWLFESPVPVFNESVAKALVARCAKEFKLKKLAPGLDEGALADPARYFELGTEWRTISPDRPVRSHFTTTWAFEASRKADFGKGGKSIPLEAVEAEVTKRWPGRWHGPFAVGAMGVRFWDPTSTNPKGAWIRETGVQAFTGECKFMHWDEIFGKAWVDKFESDRIGAAIDNVWYDGSQYWRKNDRGFWKPSAPEVYRRHLACSGLSPEKGKGGPSEVDAALHAVEEDHRIDAAFPFLYSEKDIHNLRGKTYLNVSLVRPIAPAAGTRYWGEGFPWLASLFEGLFDAQQLAVFLGWFAHAYQGALAHSARQGHALFVVGPTGSGKTLLGTKIVGPALGGYSEGTSFITGKDMFNSELFESGVWAVDDAEVAVDRAKHELYSQIVKKVVANPSMTYRKMYSEGVTLPWKGRLVVTLNMNAIEMLPNIEAELLDKVIFLLARKSQISFQGCEDKITAEMPAFLAYLRDYVISEDLLDERSDRFGLKEYHHPDLLAEARSAGPAANFAEIVDQWRVQYFATESNSKFWEGSSLEFMQALNQCDSLTQIVKQTVRSTSYIGRYFSQLLAQGTPWLSARQASKGRVFKILRPCS